MEEINKSIPNPPAFPVAIPGSESAGWHPEHIEGMTLRDYFAAKAMSEVKLTFYHGEQETKRSLKEYAEKCYQVADAMLNAR